LAQGTGDDSQANITGLAPLRAKSAHAGHWVSVKSAGTRTSTCRRAHHSEIGRVAGDAVGACGCTAIAGDVAVGANFGGGSEFPTRTGGQAGAVEKIELKSRGERESAGLAIGGGGGAGETVGIAEGARIGWSWQILAVRTGILAGTRAEL